MDKQKINKGFTNIYAEYEELNALSPMSQWKRKRVYQHLEKFLEPQSKILELNSGSCIDALHLCRKGHFVHATDIADGFVQHAKEKSQSISNSNQLTYQQISFAELEHLNVKPFDHIFSNFAGLNCIENIEIVISQFKSLLKPNGKVTMVILPKLAPWEWLRIRYGFSEGFRRLKKEGVTANVAGEKVMTYYHPASEIKKIMSLDFNCIKLENLGFFMPTIDEFSMKFTRTFKAFTKMDDNLQFIMPKGIGDFYIITLQLK